MREVVAAVLGDLGAAAAPALPSLAGAVQGEDSANVREAAVKTLVTLGDAASPAVACLVEALAEENFRDWHVCAHVARALGRLGRVALPAVAQLKVLRDRSEQSRDASGAGLARDSAASAIEQIEGSARGAGTGGREEQARC